MATGSKGKRRAGGNQMPCDMLFARGIFRVKNVLFCGAGEAGFAAFVRCIANVCHCEILDQCNSELFRI